MVERINLTARQKEIFDFIEDQFKSNGVMPTHSFIAKHFQISQPSIAKHLMALESRGWIKRSQGRKSGMMILD